MLFLNPPIKHDQVYGVFSEWGCNSLPVGMMYIASYIREYGYQHCLSSFRSVDMGVEDFQRNPEATQKALIEQAQRAIREDGAEAIILGCTIEFGFYQELQKILGVPVIDVVVSTFKMCEHLAGMKHQFHWRPSRVGSCEAPPQEELQRWGVFETEPPIGNRIEIC